LAPLLNNLLTAQLLKSRLVSGKWRDTATNVCSRRYVHLKLNYGGYSSFLSTFKNCDVVPWSSCVISSYRPQTLRRSNRIRSTLKRPQAQEFISRFGRHLREVEISGDDAETIQEILQGIPKVEKLICKSFILRSLRWDIRSQGKIKLQQLKRMEVAIGGGRTSLEALIAISGSRLQHLHLRTGCPFVTDDEGRELARLLGTIPTVAVSFNLTSTYHFTGIMRALSGRNVKVVKVILSITKAETAEFEVINRFLLSISQHLKGLVLRMDCYYEKDSTDQIMLLYLPPLQYLALDAGSAFDHKVAQFAFAYPP